MEPQLFSFPALAFEPDKCLSEDGKSQKFLGNLGNVIKQSYLCDGGPLYESIWCLRKLHYTKQQD